MCIMIGISGTSLFPHYRFVVRPSCCFFNDTSTTEIYTLSLHDALPIRLPPAIDPCGDQSFSTIPTCWLGMRRTVSQDRKSTRLNSSHLGISYAVFCLKKKKSSEMQQTYNLRQNKQRHEAADAHGTEATE